MKNFGLKEAAVVGAALLTPSAAADAYIHMDHDPGIKKADESPKDRIHKQVEELRKQLGLLSPREECKELGLLDKQEVCLARRGLEDAPFSPEAEKELRNECSARGRMVKDSLFIDHINQQKVLKEDGDTDYPYLVAVRKGLEAAAECFNDYGLYKKATEPDGIKSVY